MKEEVRQNKYVYLEFIRIFAIFWIIYNHTGSSGFFLFATRNPEEMSFWAYLIVSVFCKVAVPLFLCISGALLLGREDEGLKKLWKKRIVSMIVILFVFLLIHDLNFCYAISSDFDFKMFLKILYSGPLTAYGHLWYLYAYIVFLVLLPFLNAMVSKLEDKYFYYMIAIVIVLDVLKVLEYIKWHGELSMYSVAYNDMWINIDIVLYPCIGYFLHNRVKINRLAKGLPILWIANVIGILVACIMTNYTGNVNGIIDEWNSQKFIGSFVVINCITIFLSIRCIFEKINFSDKVEKMIISIGRKTFGIYLVHLLVKHYITEGMVISLLTDLSINSMIAALLYCLIIMLISYVIVAIWLRIPILKKLVGGK